MMRRFVVGLFVLALGLIAIRNTQASIVTYDYQGVVQGGQVTGAITVDVPTSGGLVDASNILAWSFMDSTSGISLDINSTVPGTTAVGFLNIDLLGNIVNWDLQFEQSSPFRIFYTVGSPASTVEDILGDELPAQRTGTADFVQAGQTIPEPASVAIWALFGVGLIGYASSNRKNAIRSALATWTGRR